MDMRDTVRTRLGFVVGELAMALGFYLWYESHWAAGSPPVQCRTAQLTESQRSPAWEQWKEDRVQPRASPPLHTKRLDASA